MLPLLDRADSLFRATHDHAALARLASRRSDELQFRGRLGESKSALQEVLTEAEISRNLERFAFAFSGLGALAVRLNDLPTAVDYSERSSALFTRSRRRLPSRAPPAPGSTSVTERRYAFAATALGEQDPQAPVSCVLAALADGRADRDGFRHRGTARGKGAQRSPESDGRAGRGRVAGGREGAPGTP